MTKLLFSLQTSAFKTFHGLLSWNRFYCFLVLLPLLLSGCATIAIDKNQSDLMPESVAISIFEKYGFKEWVEGPFMYFGNQKQFIEFNQINLAKFQPNRNKLFFIHGRLIGSQMISFDNVTESQALELTNAARALGATNIDLLLLDKFSN